MCNHNNLVAKEYPEENEVPMSGGGLIIAKEQKNGWAMIVSNWAGGSFSYAMGRVYVCQDCKEEFVIQSMFRLERGNNEKSK